MQPGAHPCLRLVLAHLEDAAGRLCLRPDAAPSPCVQIASFYFQVSKKPISPGIRPGYSSTSALSIINPGREVSPQCDGGWRVEEFDDDDALRQPLTANSSLSRITLSGWSRGGGGSRSGVIKWRNSLISVRQSSSVRSSGHSAASGSQQVIGSILPSSFPLLWRFDPKAYPDAPNGGSRASQQSRIGETSRFAIAGACCVGSESLRRCLHAVALGACGA